VVGGNETLSKMEMVKTDKGDRPVEDVVLKKVTIFVNPFNEEPESEEDKKKREEEAKLKEKEEVRCDKSASKLTVKRSKGVCGIPIQMQTYPNLSRRV
jgi:hypothetical protein